MEIPAMNGLGVCPPGYYGDQIMLPGAVQLPAASSSTSTSVNPYATESALSGRRPLRGLRGTAIRWDLTLLGFGAAFAGVLLYMAKRKRA